MKSSSDRNFASRMENSVNAFLNESRVDSFRTLANWFFIHDCSNLMPFFKRASTSDEV
ncbi:MAG: hypothetical protein BWY99_02196 [Synergistetes bacterium ADurb.BinA166]|nr:MAG: hypothetical protein BWY99_02196 [Synergistetes bacterium ADurb.BinA166]